MATQEEWLFDPITFAEVEAKLSERTTPESWLRQWLSILDRMHLGDELWRYCRIERDEDVGPEPGEPIAGFDQVLSDQHLEGVGLSVCSARTADYRFGFAVSRAGDVIDWIDDPPCY